MATRHRPPLQNRVDPFGVSHAVEARGGMFGNRGGKLHDPDTRRLTGRSHASRRWIACVLSFRERRRDVWGDSYTELFFLDEATALAAGHRPCFECRRAAALSYRSRFPAAGGGLPSADAMDRVLHVERLARVRPILAAAAVRALPDGAMVADGAAAFLVLGGRLRRWSFGGYGPPDDVPDRSLMLLTPPASVAALAAGYRPFIAVAE
jgi:hypothetical protein